MISKVKLVSIYVKDIDKAIAFYTEKLGFKLLKDMPFGEGMRWVEIATPEGEVIINLSLPCDGDASVIGKFSNIIFAANDVRQTYDELTARGVEFSMPPTEEFWGVYAIMKDVDGNQFCLSTEK